MTTRHKSTGHLSDVLARASAALPDRARFAGGQASRLLGPLLLAMMPCSQGCITPVVIGDGRFGLGLFNVQTENITRDVRYSRVSGAGLMLTGGRVSLGLSDHRRVTARLNHKGYSVETPMAHIAVGGEADRIASSKESLLIHPY